MSASRFYAMVLLTLAYMMNFADRQLISLLLGDIRRALQLNDLELGLISGSGFAFFYIVAGLPLGWLADRVNRTRLLAGSIMIWSVMTAACGTAGNFYQLLMARIGVGVGEAGGTPASLSLIGDYYPPALRASKIGVYFSGAAAATVLAYTGGGWLNTLVGWRLTFGLFAIPGILIGVALLLTVKEPARNSWGAAKEIGTLSFSKTIRTLFRTPLFVFLCTCYVGTNFVLYTVLVWGPSVAMRTYSLNSGQIGVPLGIASGIAAGAAHIFGGKLSDWLLRSGRHVPMCYVALMQIVSAAMIFLFLIVGNFSGFAVLFALAYAIGVTHGAPLMAVVQSLVPTNLRATAAATLLLVGSVAGLGLGPVIVGALSDALRPRFGEDSLRMTLFLLPFVSVLSALMYFVAALRLRALPTAHDQA